MASLTRKRSRRALFPKRRWRALSLAQPRLNSSSPVFICGSPRELLRFGPARKFEQERAAFSHFTFDAHPAAMRLDHMLHNTQPDPYAFGLSAQFRPQPIKAFE